ncbi:MAG TPA: hypothetical protein VNX65_01540 [Patescibacteria group bacterium]|jgi:hypothetical protein|nr:hypothetical protein [Patescibacteria group bacterium]
MKKDIIYIDVEDDITAIIGKVKLAETKIVALVPPKRVGVLQSVVNLKLLKKNATESGKQIVLITHDHSLLMLASGIKIPVAKNLQSKPELISAPSLESDDDDVINGAELPVGDIASALGHAEMPNGVEPSAADKISQHIDLNSALSTASDDEEPVTARPPSKTPSAKRSKVPDFTIFRKRFFIGIAVFILLGGVWYWAFKIAPRASVTITAKTTAVPIERNLTLDPTLSGTDISQLAFKPVVQQIKKSVSADFTATGTKDTGAKAIGIVSLSYSFDSNGVTVPAGTIFTADTGQKFSSMNAVTVPGASVSGGGVKPGKATVQVQAIDIGPEYNIPATTYAVAAYSSLTANGAAMSGGTRDKVTIITQDDINKAKASLAPLDANAVKAEVRKQFSNDNQIIDESFTTDTSDPTAVPNVGDQAKGGKLTQETTYTLVGLQRSDIKQLLANLLKDALNGKPNQSVMNDGSGSVQFQLFQKMNDNIYNVHLVTTGYIGTTINSGDIAKQIAGKRYGDIEQTVNQIPGVNKVDIKFSPFWVSQAPTSVDKINVKFTISNDSH